jgi:phosphoglycolate phosphatase
VADVRRVRLADFDAAIVDLDGTLVDTLGDFVAVLALTFADLRLPPLPRQAVERYIGKGSEHLIERSLQHVGADASLLYATAWEAYQRHYAVVNGDHADVFPGTVEGLQRMRSRGLKLACLTNKPGAFAEALLRRKGLDRYFAVVFGGDAFERKKPDPQPVLMTCQALATTPPRTLVIGDSSNDAEAARAAGCPIVLVSYGYNHGRPVAEMDADGVIDRIDQLD